LAYAVVITLILVVALPLLYELAYNNAEIREGRERLAALEERERLLNIENEQLRRYSNGENLDEYIERFARDEMRYADPHERIFYVNPG
jgi:cell division protein FtsB